MGARLPAAPVERILATQVDLIQAIEHALSLPDDLYQIIAAPVIARYAAFSHLLPASESHHHRGAGGLFRHGLEVAHWATQAAQGCLFATQATPRERKEQELRWRLAVCFAGLLHDIGKPVSDMAVVDRQGEHTWNPCDENLTDWAAQNGIDRYFLRWRENRHKRHEQFSALVIERVLTRASRTYLLEPGPDIMQANMTLDGIGAKLEKHYGAKTNAIKRSKTKINFIRYADDFVITGAMKETLEEARAIIVEYLRERGLSLSEEKTKIVHIEEGFDFLGWNVRKYGEKLLIKPAKKNVQAFLRKIRRIFKENRTAKQENVIRLLNPVIRRWADYHKHQVAKETFNKVDSAIWKQLWQWACRRHPNKPRKWIKDKYFMSEGLRNWVFGSTVKTEDGSVKKVALVKASDTPIRRHTKIKGAANPFDPAWEEYFENRFGLKMKDSPRGKNQLLILWYMQEGLCPNCHEKITKETGWKIHYIQRKTDGGKGNVLNLMLLHPKCHRQMHSRDKKVTAASG